MTPDIINYQSCNYMQQPQLGLLYESSKTQAWEYSRNRCVCQTFPCSLLQGLWCEVQQCVKLWGCPCVSIRLCSAVSH